MFNTYYSDKIEWLADLLAKKLQINSPPVFEKINISIDKFLLGEWVKNQITLSNGIFAHCEIKSITDLTKTLVKEIEQTNTKYYWDLESLKWAILNSLEELGKYKEVWPIEFWVKKLNSHQTIDKGLYYFSINTAKNFLDYSRYRPELIYKWQKTDIHSKNLFKNLNKDEYWQPLLFKLLEKYNYNFLSLDILEVIQAIDKKVIKDPNIQKEINIITTESISKLYLDFYQKVSKFSNVNLYVFSPGFELWERTNIEIENSYKSNQNNNKRIDPIPDIKFGKSFANLEKLLEENGIANEISINEELLYSDPLNFYKKKKEIPLLKQLQNSIINKTNNSFKKFDADSSIIFKELPNIINELEFIKLEIQDLLKNEIDIRLSDIAIVTPDIKLIKRHLSSVLTNFKTTGIELPFIVSKTNYAEISNIFGYIHQLIDISTGNIDNLSLKNLFNNFAIKEIFNLETDEINIFADLIKESGFDWGLDKNDRMGEYRNSLDWCLEKIKLGLIYDEKKYFKEYDLSPIFTGIDNINLHKILRIVDLFISHIKLFKKTKNINEWIESLEIILEDLFHKNYCYEINAFKSIIQEYKNNYACKKKIDIFTFRECLDSLFNKSYSCLNNRKNEVLISEMKSICCIPYKYIFICGMNDNYYPRKFLKENHNIIQRNKIFGDPNKNDIEKDIFLNFLISCKNKLFITWSKKDSEGKILNISLPVKRLQKFIESNSESEKILETNSNESKKLIPNSENFLKKNHPIIKSLDWNYEINNDNIYKISQLQKLLKEPQRYWLIKKNIKPIRKFKLMLQKEISPLKKIKFLEKITNKIKIDHINFEKDILNLDLKKEIISDGFIAPKNSIIDLEKDFKEILKSLIEIINNFKVINQVSFKDKINREKLYIANNELIELKHTKLSLTNIVDAWLRLLFAVSQNDEIESTKLILLKENKYNIKEIKSPGKKEAIKILSTYSNMYFEYQHKCLPIPPISSFNFINALKFHNYEKAINIFNKTWVGSEFSLGERDKDEMKLCFGESIDPDFFIKNNLFYELAKSLYQPIVNSLDKERNFLL